MRIPTGSGASLFEHPYIGPVHVLTCEVISFISAREGWMVAAMGLEFRNLEAVGMPPAMHSSEVAHPSFPTTRFFTLWMSHVGPRKVGAKEQRTSERPTVQCMRVPVRSKGVHKRCIF